MDSVKSITDKIKRKMGKDFPNDLIIEFDYPRLRFYRKDYPHKDSIGNFEIIDNDDLKRIVLEIKRLY